MDQKVLGKTIDFQWSTRVNINDSGKVYMPSAGSNGGIGIAHIGDGEEYAFFTFTSSGVVTLISNSGNVGTTEDNNTTFNIFDAGDVVGFNNELGSNKNLLVIVWFS
ncbi:hypothetical protein KAR91_04070 [Candidatus Pacearchaeota archaeon]|nr:hypothetical protein [Candidatus Pacearchaeota archaeon]